MADNKTQPRKRRAVPARTAREVMRQDAPRAPATEAAKAVPPGPDIVAKAAHDAVEAALKAAQDGAAAARAESEAGIAALQRAGEAAETAMQQAAAALPQPSSAMPQALAAMARPMTDPAQAMAGLMGDMMRAQLRLGQELMRLANPAGLIEMQQQMARRWLDAVVASQSMLLHSAHGTAEDMVREAQPQMHPGR